MSETEERRLSLWERLTGRAAAAPRAQTVLSSDVTPNSEAWSWFVESGGASGLPALSEQSALTVSAIYACVVLIAGAIAALPVPIYHRSSDGELTMLPSDTLWWMLNEEFVPRWSAANAWEFLTQALLLHGNAYARIQRNPRGEIVGLMPIHPLRVSVVVSSDGMRLIYVVSADPLIVPVSNAQQEIVDQDDMLHIAGFGFDGRQGLSVIRHALRMVGASALAMQDYAGRFFANNARPDFLLQSDQALGTETIEKLKAQLDEAHKGVANAHRPLVLGNGLKFQSITMPITDQELVAQRGLQIEEVARIYGVPPHMIGRTEKNTSWGAGIENMGTAFVRYALRQHLNKFETELNRKLFRTAGKMVKFDTTELERADMKSLMESLRTGIGRAGEKPIITVNEARSVLHRNKVANGDNMEPVMGAATDPAASPADQPQQDTGANAA